MTGRRIRLPPSGAQHEIVVGDQRAVLVEVGGGIREYSCGGHDVLDGYPVTAMCDGARGVPLAPWPNRVGDGRYIFDGVEHQLALSEPAAGNAIHGLTRWRNWVLRDRDDTRVVLGTVLRPCRGYPFTLDVAVEYVLRELGAATDPGLTVSTTATNLGDTDCPYGTGFHPYLAPGGGLVDDALLTFDAGTWLPTDDRGLPAGREPVAESPYDFRPGRRIGEQRVDHAFTDLARDEGGRAWVRLERPAGRCTRLWVDAEHRVIQVFTGDTLAPDRRRRGLAVEPMTCPPDAFRTGDGLRRLAPGESLTTRWGVVPGSAARWVAEAIEWA